MSSPGRIASVISASMCALQALPLHRPVGLVLVEPEVPLQYLDAVKRFAYLQQRPLNLRADSPAASEVPGTLRSVSRRVQTPSSWMRNCGTPVMLRGVSINGSVNFCLETESGCGVLTSTDSVLGMAMLY
jgi:hypothetical protein